MRSNINWSFLYCSLYSYCFQYFLLYLWYLSAYLDIYSLIIISEPTYLLERGIIYCFQDSIKRFIYKNIIIKEHKFLYILKKNYVIPSIEQKGMTFDHDFGYTFPVFSSLLKRRELEKEKELEKS